MTRFIARTAKHFALIKAAKKFKTEIELAGLDSLKILAANDISIVRTYFSSCSPEERATYKRDLNALGEMGITPEMLLEEVARQMPELVPIIESKQDYKKAEIQNLEKFLQET